MRIVEIAALKNGAHRNQNGGLSFVPSGWALIPEGMELENFPFGDLTVKTIKGVKMVTVWTPGVIPEPAHEESTTSEAVEE